MPSRRNNYRRGANFERAVKAHLEERGCPYVIRSAGSHGVADLVAAYPRDRWVLIQCKLDGKLPPAEADQLIDLGDTLGARVALAAKGKRGKIHLYWVKPLDGEIVYEEWEA